MYKWCVHNVIRCNNRYLSALMITYIIYCILTCLSTWEEYNRREIMDCSPHIPLFLSFRRIVTAMQRPGWCALVTADCLCLSLDMTIEERIFRRVGAICDTSLTSTFHWNEEHLLASILRNGERGFVNWHMRRHSELTLFTIRSNTISLRSLWSMMASATEGKWPLARTLPMSLVDSLNVEEVDELPDRSGTITCGIKMC